MNKGSLQGRNADKEESREAGRKGKETPENKDLSVVCTVFVCLCPCVDVPVCACAYVCVCSVGVSLCACVPVCVHMNMVVMVTAES